jgi:hypothetical protein
MGKDRQNNNCRIWFGGTQRERGRESFSGHDEPHGRRFARKRLPTPSAERDSSSFAGPKQPAMSLLTKRKKAGRTWVRHDCRFYFMTFVVRLYYFGERWALAHRFPCCSQVNVVFRSAKARTFAERKTTYSPAVPNPKRQRGKSRSPSLTRRITMTRQSQSESVRRTFGASCFARHPANARCLVRCSRRGG